MLQGWSHTPQIHFAVWCVEIVYGIYNTVAAVYFCLYPVSTAALLLISSIDASSKLIQGCNNLLHHPHPILSTSLRTSPPLSSSSLPPPSSHYDPQTLHPSNPTTTAAAPPIPSVCYGSIAIASTHRTTAAAAAAALTTIAAEQQQQLHSPLPSFTITSPNRLPSLPCKPFVPTFIHIASLGHWGNPFFTLSPYVAPPLPQSSSVRNSAG